MAEKKLTGKIARERIRLMETPPAPVGIIEEQGLSPDVRQKIFRDNARALFGI